MKKKICFIASSPSGIKSFQKTNISRLAEKFDVYAIANFKDREELGDIQIKEAFPVNIERRPSIIQNVKALVSLYQVFKKQKFDCFVSMSCNASLLAAIAGKLAGIPFRIRIFTGQVWANMTGVKRAVFKMLDRLTITLNTNTMVDGKAQFNFLAENRIIEPDKTECLPNIVGIDTELFKPVAKVRAIERARLSISDNKFVFAFLGRVNKDKGIFELLAAANRLFKEGANACLVIIGPMEDGLTDEIVAGFNDLKLGDNVFFYGKTQQPYNALQVADAFCLPSYREGFGLSVLEASATELPVICSDAYGMQSAYEENVTGLKCKKKDVDSLYECMKLLYETPELSHSLGKGGRDRVKRTFNKDIVSKCWYNYLSKVVGVES
jgi:glycosyltransferase involved in cell wall biosynthesis